MNQYLIGESKEAVMYKPDITPRQQKILDLLQQGKLIPDIVKELDIHFVVVYEHIRRAEKKGYVRVTAVRDPITLRVVRYNVENLKH
jgi:DNA-binding CsgD family transcriptional regulator